MASPHKGLTDRIFGGAGLAGWAPGAALAALRRRFGAAMDEEWDLRRPFLWLPAAGGRRRRRDFLYPRADGAGSVDRRGRRRPVRGAGLCRAGASRPFHCVHQVGGDGGGRVFRRLARRVGRGAGAGAHFRRRCCGLRRRGGPSRAGRAIPVARDRGRGAGAGKDALSHPPDLARRSRLRRRRFPHRQGAAAASGPCRAAGRL
jgi:hypothetical protein